MPTCCLGQRQLALQHGQHDLDLLVHSHLPGRFLRLLTQTPFVTGQLRTLPEVGSPITGGRVAYNPSGGVLSGAPCGAAINRTGRS